MLLFTLKIPYINISWLVSFLIHVRTRVTLLIKKIILSVSNETKLEVCSHPSP